MAQTVKNLSAMWETWVQSLGWKDILEEGMATHSSIPAWRIPMVRGAWRAAIHGLQRVGHDRVTKQSTAKISCLLKIKTFCFSSVSLLAVVHRRELSDGRIQQSSAY